MFTDAIGAIEEAEFLADSTRMAHSVVSIEDHFEVVLTDTARRQGMRVLETVSVVYNN